MVIPIQISSIADPINLLDVPYYEATLRPMDELYTEAVFTEGKQKIKGIEEIVGKIKAELEAEVTAHTDSKPFNPETFWRNKLWKDLENEVQKVFNFRVVTIGPYLEKYLSAEKEFETKELNCMVYSIDRFPIDGLVTDKGFYDSTRSCQMEIYMSCGLIRALTPPEIVGVFLHEFGHGVDPALVDLKYAEVNLLSKYLTDRKKEVKIGEEKAVGKKGSVLRFLKSLFHLDSESNNSIKKFIKRLSTFRASNGDKKEKIVIYPWENDKDKLKRIEKELSSDRSRFTRQDYSEAYADNFARMYGYGVPLTTALKKMNKHYSEKAVNRFKMEKSRQTEITKMIISALRDEHKTPLVRALALEREMKNDIKDPNTPEKVKEQLKEDLKQLEAVIDAFQNDYSDFQNRCHKLILEDFRSKES